MNSNKNQRQLFSLQSVTNHHLGDNNPSTKPNSLSQKVQKDLFSKNSFLKLEAGKILVTRLGVKC